jgi:hypothetical protein
MEISSAQANKTDHSQLMSVPRKPLRISMMLNNADKKDKITSSLLLNNAS